MAWAAVGLQKKLFFCGIRHSLAALCDFILCGGECRKIRGAMGSQCFQVEATQLCCAMGWGGCSTGGEWLYLQYEFKEQLLSLIFNTRGACPYRVVAAL